MTKNLKKTLASLLAVSMLLSMTSVSAFALEAEEIPAVAAEEEKETQVCETCGEEPCVCLPEGGDDEDEAPEDNEPEDNEPVDQTPVGDQPVADAPAANEPEPEEPEDEEFEALEAMPMALTEGEEEEPVAQVGDTTYTSLQKAIEAATEGQTVTLVNNFTVPEGSYVSYNMPENSVLELNGKTLTVPYTAAVFQGENVTIQNGRFESTADYAVWIGNGDKTTVTLKNVSSNAGVNIFAASAELENCNIDASTKAYYAVWTDNGYAKAVIKSGTYIGGTNGVVHTTTGENDDGSITPPELEIQGGTFTGEVKQGYNGSVSISGGSFSGNVSDYLAPTVTQNTEGTVVPLTADNGVAEVGGKYYSSLQAAITAAETGDTVTLLRDVAESADIKIQKAITLDLGGYTITNSGTLYLCGFEGEAVVKNGTVEGTGTSGVWAIQASAKLENMTVTAPNAKGYAVRVGRAATGDWGSAEIVDCTIAGTANAGVGVVLYGPYGNDDEIDDLVTTLKVSGNTNISGNYYGIVGNGAWHNTKIEIGEGVNVTGEYMGLYHPQVGTVVTSGNITGKQECGIEIRAGELTVLGGTVTSEATKFSCDPNNNGTTTVGAAIAIAQHTTKKDITVTISGGEFKGVKALNESNPLENDPAPQVTLSVTGGDFQGDIATVDVEKFISGGSFSTDVKDYVVDGSTTFTEDNDTWTIVPAENSVAAIGNVGYTTVQAAIDNANSGETVTLVADEVSENDLEIVAGKDITLDLNGKKLNVADTKKNTYAVYLGGKLTIKDSTDAKANGEGTGHLSYKSDCGLYLEGGTLIVDSGFISGTKPVNVCVGTNNEDEAASTCTINGGKLNANSNVILWTQKDSTLTLNGGVLEGFGGVEMRAGTLEIPETSTVKITATGLGGEFAHRSQSGSNIFGAAISIDHYQGVTADIEAGEFSGYYALLDIYTSDDTNWNNKVNKITVTGGKFVTNASIGTGSAVTNEPQAVYTTTEGTIAISGGEFTTEIPAGYCAEGFAPVKTGDTYGVNNTLTLRPATLSMTVGRTATITAETTADEIEWISNDASVATVENGVVTAVGTGTANITATVNGVSATCTVTVTRASSSSGGGSARPNTPVEEEDVVDEEPPLADKPFLFEDVAENDWFYNSVKFVFDQDLMNGVSDTRFDPYTTTNRGMIVTMLHRLEGEPEAAGSQFPDVAGGQWYTAAVAWGVSAGIAKGYDDGSFRPDAQVSREQLAAFLYRYAQVKGYDVTGRDDLSGFTDGEKVSDWALEAMQWAVSEGLLEGDGDILNPLGSATRCEAAEVMARFAKAHAEAEAE